MIRGAYISRLHGASLLWTEDAVDHESSLEPKEKTVIADPILLRQLLNTIAALVNWDVAVPTEHDHVLVLIVTAIADHTLCIVLNSHGPSVCSSGC
jgi:hypothetical protein